MLKVVVAGDWGGERCKKGETKKVISYVGGQIHGDNERDGQSVGDREWREGTKLFFR